MRSGMWTRTPGELHYIHGVSFHMMAYDYIHVHHTLKKARNGILTTPAMAAGVTDRACQVDKSLRWPTPNYSTPSRNFRG